MNRKQMDSDPINTPKPDTLGNVSIDDYIFRIEDYVGGNIEGVETIDRMGFTVFLRRILEEVLDQTEAIFNEAMLELKLVNGYRGEHKRVAPSKYYSEKCACGFGTRIDQKLPTGFMGDHIRLANAKLKEAK